MKDIRKSLGDERRKLQEEGLLPAWFTTDGWALFKSKYLYEGYRGYTDTCTRIASTLAKHTPDPSYWEKKFQYILDTGVLAPSTPVAANTGTPKGDSVSCSGGFVPDSVDGFYKSRHETAMLTKRGFGTSGYLGDIRPRGADISTSGGKASGVVPVFKMFVRDMKDITQGTRRGNWAGYLPIDHEDFYELIGEIHSEPDNFNVGFNYSDEFIKRLQNGDEEALDRYQTHMKLRAIQGKGYFYFPDKVADLQPEMYKDLGLRSKGSNLCSEITLHSDENLSFTCVLSSLNLVHWDKIKEEKLVFVATVFLDCVAQEFIENAKGISGLEKCVKFTELGRPLGLGALGWHTLLQMKSIPFESFDAHLLNIEIFKHIQEESLRASQWMARNWGEPEWCKGYGVRNTHRTAIAPNLSSSQLAGGVSQGIEPIYTNVYSQTGTSGEIDRINPILLTLMKERGVYDKTTIERIGYNNGSVQEEDWLSEHEKAVFKTAFEIDQRSIIRLASARQKYICQSQSLNLFFDANETEEYISEIHQEAILDPMIKSLYYMRTQLNVKASKDSCWSCEG